MEKASTAASLATSRFWVRPLRFGRAGTRPELLRLLMLPDFDRADRIGEFWSYPESRNFAELLIDCGEDRTSGPCWRHVARGRSLTEWPVLRRRLHVEMKGRPAI